MMLTLQREPGEHATPGTLTADEGRQYHAFTLEDPIRERAGEPVSAWKIRGNTAIPAGLYRVALTPSARFKRVMLQILDVPGFAGIRIHNGDGPEDTEGCPLVNYRRHPTDPERLADYDRRAMIDLELLVAAAIENGEEVQIQICNPVTEAV